MKKMLLIVAIGASALFIFQPVAGQGGGPYIDALATQAALNTQATLTAYQQQQDAAGAASAAAAAQAQAQAALAAAAQAQANAAYAAQQATQQAGQQQAALAAAQSTADTAALQATAIVQQTRTAIEIKVTATAQALQARATQGAIDATRTIAAAQADAQRRDNEAIATSVAMSIEATRVASNAEQGANLERLNAEISTSKTLLNLLVICGIVVGVAFIALCGKMFWGLWRSRALNPPPGPAAPLPMTPTSSAASASVVDADTGDVGNRFALIEYDDDPQSLENWLGAIYGQ